MNEETGHAPGRLWTIPSVNAFYEWQDDRINLIPAFAATLPADPTLDGEHVFIGGTEMPYDSRQKRLLRRYEDLGDRSPGHGRRGAGVARFALHWGAGPYTM